MLWENMGLIERASPFMEPLLETPYTKTKPAIRRLQRLPGKIVRADDYKADQSELVDTPIEKLWNSIQSMDTALSLAKQGGIAIPNYERAALVVYHGSPVVYTVVDEVIGKNIADAMFTSEELRIVVPAIDKTYTKFVQVADYAFFHGGSLLYNITHDQFVWGNVSGERNRIYFVDLEPDMSFEVKRYNGELTTDGELFFRHMIDLVVQSRKTENKFGVRMNATRREFRVFADQFDGTAYQEYAQKLLDFLYTKRVLG